MRVYLKETNNGYVTFATDGIKVKANYLLAVKTKLSIDEIATCLHVAFIEMIVDDMLQSFDDMDSDDEWIEPFIEDLVQDCKLVIDTKEYEHENSQY